MIAAADGGRLLGAGMVGPQAGELIQGLAVALSAGATLDDLGRTLGIHPTLAEEFVSLGNVPYSPRRNEEADPHFSYRDMQKEMPSEVVSGHYF